jgi:hypothetical protein
MQVNHQLHCLVGFLFFSYSNYSTIQLFSYSAISSPLAQNRLRQFLYLPYYKHTAFAKEHGESYTMGHAEHCINYLRHSIQCPADLTPMLWQKKDNSSQALQEVTSLALDMETMYTCRKWGPIHGASSRQVNYAKREDLVQGGGKFKVLD